MHRVWAIPELLLNVLCYLDRRDQACMARVSLYLWATTLPKIWETLPPSHDTYHLRHLFLHSVYQSEENTLAGGASTTILQKDPKF